MTGENPVLLADSHLDLAFNALQLKRDLTQSVESVRAHDPEPIIRNYGTCTTTFPELRRGHVGLIFGTVMTRIDPNDNWTQTGMYAQSQCYGIGYGHVSYYRALERMGVLRFCRRPGDLDDLESEWNRPEPAAPVGLVLAMEGADSIMGPDQVPEWYELGLRMVSISHYGTSSYSHGTGTEGGILPRAGDLLEALKRTGIIVDLTHLTDQAFWEVLEVYDGPVAASHHNCRALVPGQRQLADEMILAIAERGGVIGAALDSWMLDPAWKHDVPACEQRSNASLETVVDHMEYIMKLTGSPAHCGIGSDLDGGYGQEQAPRDLNTVADLQKLKAILEHRGHSPEDIRRIFSGNWIRLLKETWSRKK
ncbi:MAG TPA: membrane dipeptidase [Spirochaetia bacterium]|nr:membrane dipeptidase [Spirochaetia bacterium]